MSASTLVLRWTRVRPAGNEVWCFWKEDYEEDDEDTSVMKMMLMVCLSPCRYEEGSVQRQRQEVHRPAAPPCQTWGHWITDRGSLTCWPSSSSSDDHVTTGREPQSEAGTRSQVKTGAANKHPESSGHLRVCSLWPPGPLVAWTKQKDNINICIQSYNKTSFLRFDVFVDWSEGESWSFSEGAATTGAGWGQPDHRQVKDSESSWSPAEINQV